MTQILFPTKTEKPLVFYLAAEEYLARTLEEGEYVFFWSVAPTVIFGRNQIMSAEVNLEWCRENGVETVRRRSGGGCVYADRGNLMISCIFPGMDVEYAFGRYLQTMSRVLCKTGLDASVSGRNDIVAGGRKISGNACHTAFGRSIVHGTLMYDVDIDAMSKAITPSVQKLHRKGVASVRQRVGNVRPMLDKVAPGLFPDIRSLASWLAVALCDGNASLQSWMSGPAEETAMMLTEEDESRISELSGKYLDRSFLFGKEEQEMNLL